MTTFNGFPVPEANYSKLPHVFIDHYLADIKSLAELKVILYILRHTWGFSEFGQPKKITTDEFMNGRRKRDRSRMDRGVGLSRPSVITGLKKAVEDGFLLVETDDRDRGRIKKSYMLRMQTKPEGQKLIPRGKLSLPLEKSEVKKVYPTGKEGLPRSEKETLRKKGPGDPLSSLWATVLAELRAQVTKGAFLKWLKPTELLALEKDRAVVSCADSAYQVDWLSSRLRKPIERTLSALAGVNGIKIEFRFQPSLF